MPMTRANMMPGNNGQDMMGHNRPPLTVNLAMPPPSLPPQQVKIQT